MCGSVFLPEKKKFRFKLCKFRFTSWGWFSSLLLIVPGEKFLLSSPAFTGGKVKSFTLHFCMLSGTDMQFFLLTWDHVQSGFLPGKRQDHSRKKINSVSNNASSVSLPGADFLSRPWDFLPLNLGDFFSLFCMGQREFSSDFLCFPFPLFTDGRKGNSAWKPVRKQIWSASLLALICAALFLHVIRDGHAIFTDFKVSSWGNIIPSPEAVSGSWKGRGEKIPGRKSERLWGRDFLLKPWFQWGVNRGKEWRKEGAKKVQSGRKRGEFFPLSCLLSEIFFFTSPAPVFFFLPSAFHCFTWVIFFSILHGSGWKSSLSSFSFTGGKVKSFTLHFCPDLLLCFSVPFLLLLTFHRLITTEKQNGFPEISWNDLKRKWNFSVILTWRSKQTFKWSPWRLFFWPLLTDFFTA